jgi:hypothetical protein
MADRSIQTKDGITNYPTEDAFLAALKALFSGQQQFVSATKADGTMIDETAARALAGFEIGKGGIGETPI